jgi:hypothetical protein
MLNETWLAKKDIFIGGFDVIRKERTQRKGGATAILLRKKFKYGGLAFYDCDECVEFWPVILYLVGGKLLMATGYWPTDKSIADKKWLRLLSVFHLRFLPAEDLSAHYIHLGSPYCMRRRE